MYCHNCGAKLDDDARFCSECGAKIISISERRELAARSKEEGAAAALSSAPGPDSHLGPVSVGPTAPVTEPLPTQSSHAAVVLKAPYNMMGAAAFCVAACLYLITCVLIRSFSLSYVLSAIACVAAAALCYLRLPILDKVLPAWAVVRFVLSLGTNIWFRLRFGVLLGMLSELPIWLLNAAYVIVLALVCLDRVKNRKNGAIALVALAAALELVSLATGVIQVRNMPSYGTSVGYVVALRLAMFFATAGQTLVAYVLEKGREPGGEWRKAPSVSKSASVSAGVAPVAPDDSYTHYPHPYHELGGWLKAIVVMGYVGAALVVLGGVMGVVALGYLSNRLGGLNGAGTAVVGIGSVVILVAAVAVCAFLLVFLGKIRCKDPTFLRDYHLFFIVSTVLALVTMVVSGSFRSLPSLLSAWITMGLYTLYFVKSVRVRTYMGTDAYLRLSPLVKNVPSPTPADTVPYQASQQ